MRRIDVCTRTGIRCHPVPLNRMPRSRAVPVDQLLIGGVKHSGRVVRGIGFSVRDLARAVLTRAVLLR